MSTTLASLRTLTYALLREEENSSAYSYTLVDAMINSAQQRLCSWTIVNAFTREEITKWNLPFLEARVFYANIKGTGLNTDCIIGWTVVVADTTGYPTTGSLWIEWEVVKYTWTDPTQFTWVTWITYAHKSGTKVYPIFALPADYMSTEDVAYNNAISVPYKATKQIYRDRIGRSKQYLGSQYQVTTTNTTTPFPYQPPFYTIWDWIYFAPFWIDNSTGFFTMHYMKKPTILTTPASICVIPDDEYATVLAYLAGGEVMFNRGEWDAASTLLTFAYGQVKEMYAYFNNKSSENLDGQYVIADKGLINV